MQNSKKHLYAFICHLILTCQHHHDEKKNPWNMQSLFGFRQALSATEYMCSLLAFRQTLKCIRITAFSFRFHTTT